MSTSAAQQVREDRLIAIVTTHRAALLAYTRRLVGTDSTRAEDVVQETFVRAWHRIDRLTADHGSVIGWLRRVAYNVAMDGHRMRQARPVEVELTNSDIAAVKDHSDDIVTAVAVREMLNEVWPEHRAVLVEVYLNDRSTAQTAAKLGIPVGTVKSRLHYALQKLRAGMQNTPALVG
jgi:RNA polymerase sigma-70 factor, ECF subfamily